MAPPPPKKSLDDGLAKPQPAAHLGEVVRAVVIAAILSAGSTAVLASRLDERVKSNREAAETSLNAAVALRRADQALLIQKDIELERSLLLMQTAQKEVVSIMQGLAKDNAAFREEAIRRLTTLDERMGYITKNIEELRSRRQ
jgi:hypothetical protein